MHAYIGVGEAREFSDRESFRPSRPVDSGGGERVARGNLCRRVRREREEGVRHGFPPPGEDRLHHPI
ncbi:MAG TPA: hypothetical protein VFI56_06910, partial [Vicinamibacterales bacterium]|nr:hypothetical protein [Vicinamibacterales bacterium]